MSHRVWTARNIIVRCLVILAGTVVAGFGCAAYICAVLGSDPVSVLVQGLQGKLGLGSFGMAMNIYNIAFFVFLLFFGRKMIHLGTIIYTFLLGTFNNLFIALINSILGNDPSVAIRSVFLVLGVLALGLGLGIYQSARLGCGPTDGFNQIVSERLKIPLKWERVGCDVIMTVLGWFMGGVIGVGTILGMIATGPVMAPTIIKLAPVVDCWAGTAENEVDA